MPSPVEILSGLHIVANQWIHLAIAWHVALGLLLGALVLGWRPPQRSLGLLIAAPAASVSLLAWWTGNPFNAVAFALLTGLLVWVTRRLPPEPARCAGPVAFGAGLLLVAFGWGYPHFLEGGTWTRYAYAAPTGLLPCPTLSVMIGLSLMLGPTDRFWRATLASAGFLYGGIGVFRLGVGLDYALLAGATALVVALAALPRRSVRATAAEQMRDLPGDEMIDAPLATLTHAVTIACPAREVWPWLVQMGAGTRAGWYSYDLLDNGRRQSARRIMPDLQRPTVGTVFPAAPGETSGFTLLAFEPECFLLLGWLGPEGRPVVTWAFVLEAWGLAGARLITRARGGSTYSFHGLPTAVGRPLVQAVHFVMQRKQLLGIAARAERSDSLLDHFIPSYDIVERHQIRVAAPPAVVLETAREMNLLGSAGIRSIFRAREILLRAAPDSRARPAALVAGMEAIGWRVHAEIPGREVVVGAAAQPWQADVRFRPIPPDAFAAFGESDFVKIAWTLRADPDGRGGAIFRTETRVAATDASARRKFRRYWRTFSPGIVAIRWLLLRPLKAAAEARAAEQMRQNRSTTAPAARPKSIFAPSSPTPRTSNSWKAWK